MNTGGFPMMAISLRRIGGNPLISLKEKNPRSDY
jgi:hypothetical protein